ncbi:hypothetical protein CVT26_005152, partial [Gymnopilus dilepis]
MRLYEASKIPLQFLSLLFPRDISALHVRTPSKIPSRIAATPHAPGSGGSCSLLSSASPCPPPPAPPLTYTALPILALIPLVFSAPSLAFLTASSKVDLAPPGSDDDREEQNGT